MKAVRAEIDRRVLMKGESLPRRQGGGRQEGCAGNWTDKGEAECCCPSSMPKVIQDHAVMFKRGRCSRLTQIMEKALKNSPQTWKDLQAPCITQTEGKPAVVPL
jgi:hypothetical protein